MVELQTIDDQIKTKATRSVAKTSRITKDNLRESIWRHHGILTLVAVELDLNYIQLHRLLARHNLRDEVEKAKNMMFEEAQSTIFDALKSKSESTRLRAAEILMKYTMPKSGIQISIDKTSDGKIDVKSIFGVQ